MLPRLILFGLGNPGDRYHGTRHNMGFLVLDSLAAKHKAAWSDARIYWYTELVIDDTRLILVKPKIYMNRSGRVLRDFQEEPIAPGELLVVVDDFALLLGQLRLRRKGSDGGHNGLRSIADALETTEFPRLRMGVGPVPADEDPADFVLERFADGEGDTVVELAERAVACIEDVVKLGFDRAMTLHNVAAGEESV